MEKEIEKEMKIEGNSQQNVSQISVQTNLSVISHLIAILLNSVVINVLFIYVCVFYLEFKSYFYYALLVIAFNVLRSLLEWKIRVTDKGELVDESQFVNILNALPFTRFTKIGTEKLWVNRIISDIWPNIRLYLCSQLAEKNIQQYFVIKEFDIGTKPLTVDTVYCNDKHTRDGCTLMFDVPFEFYSKDMNVTLAFIFLEYITAGIEELYIKGSMRVIIQLDNFKQNVAPDITEMRFSFLQPPNVIYCKPNGILSPLDWLSNSEIFVSKLIANYLLLPKCATIRFGDKKDKEENNKLDAAKSIVRIDILYATQIIFKQRDIISVINDHKPNTFCTVVLGNSAIYATKIIESIYPIWNQYFIFPVGSENLRLEIKLYDSVEEKDELLFTYKCDDIFKEFNAINGKEKVLQLTENKNMFHSGILTFRVNLLSLSESYDDLVKSAQLTSYRFPSGVFSVCLNHATGLQNLPIHEVLHSRVLNTFVEVTFGHQMSKTDIRTGNSPIWDEVLHFICSSPHLQNITFKVYAKIKTADYCLGFVETPVQLVLSESNLKTKLRFPLQGISKDAYLSVTFRFKPAVPMKGFLGAFRSSEKRVNDSIKKIAGIEPEKKEEPKPLKKEPIGVSVQKFSDMQVHILLRFVWQKSMENKLMIDIIEVKNIPKINGQTPDPYVVIEMLNESLEVLDSKKTVIKRMTTNPVYNETKIFEKIDTHRIHAYLFRVSVYFKSTKKNQYNKLASDVIPFPKHLKKGIDYYQQWYPLATGHRHTEGLSFVHQLRTSFDNEDETVEEEQKAIDEFPALFENNQNKMTEVVIEETMFSKFMKLFSFKESKEKIS